MSCSVSSWRVSVEVAPSSFLSWERSATIQHSCWCHQLISGRSLWLKWLALRHDSSADLWRRSVIGCRCLPHVSLQLARSSLAFDLVDRSCSVKAESLQSCAPSRPERVFESQTHYNNTTLKIVLHTSAIGASPAPPPIKSTSSSWVCGSAPTSVGLVAPSGELRHVWMRAFPVSLVIIGCNLRVANVYTWPVSLATNSITCVPVSVDSS